MLSSIHPLGERNKGNRWWMTVAAHIVGSVIGGAAVGAALGLVGAVLRPVARPAALVIALAALAIDLGQPHMPLPRWRRQVDEQWLVAYRGWVYGLGYGVQLGAGLVTIVTAATVYLVFALALFSGSVGAGALIGGVFGLVRGATVLAGARIETVEQLRQFHRRMARAARPTRWVPCAADAVVVAALIGLFRP